MTTQTQHTQGPWHRNIKPASKYNTIFAGRNTHVTRLATDGLTEDEIEANCNLIASAPELLEALKKIVEDYEPGEIYLSTSIDKAKLAIAKAQGKTL